MNTRGSVSVIAYSSLLTFVFLNGCSTWQKLDKTERGVIIGASTGAVIGGASGSTTGALVGGTAGGVAGGFVGRELDDDEDEKDG